MVDGKRQVLLAADTDKVAGRILRPVPLEVVGGSGGCADEGTPVLSVMVPLTLLPLEMCCGCVMLKLKFVCSFLLLTGED